MTGPGRQKVAQEFHDDLDLIRQNWEGYHLLEFANTILPKKQDVKGRKKLDALLKGYGLSGIKELQGLPSSKISAFIQKKSNGVFKSLAEFQDIPHLVCFSNFLEFCKNSHPPRPLKVFDKNNLILTREEKIPVTLEHSAFKYVHTLNSGSNFCIHMLRRAAVCCRWFSTKHRMTVPWLFSKWP
ncbi:hypothetical protein SAMN05428977_10441 [Nitrosomonas sp. Nm166]|nr:hypothetical protein SAMN05428977_10441 [Nitrosomonas sp. Nm166]